MEKEYLDDEDDFLDEEEGDSRPNEYFASKGVDEIGEAIVEKAKLYYEHLDNTGVLQLWRRSYIAYHRSMYHNGQMLESGEQGEYTLLYVNQFRNFVQNILTLTTANRPYFEPQTVNTDYVSQSIAILAKGLLDYYSKEKNMERIMEKAAELATYLGEGFATVEWDTWSGEDYIPDEDGKMIKEGDLKFRVYSPIDMIRDFNAKSSSDVNWYIARQFVNRYDLASRFPENKEEIMGATYVPDRDYLDTRALASQRWVDSDYIPIYTLYHDRTTNLEDGRLVICLNDGEVLLDSPLPYPKLPVFRVSTSDIEETIFGYTVAFDLLPLQEMINVLTSSIATNLKNGAVTDFLKPRGCNLDYSAASSGMNIWEYDPMNGKPEILDKLKTPQEVYSFLKDLTGFMEQISGINAAVRGNPPPGLTAGVSLALLSSNAIQYSQRLQQSYNRLAEDLGTNMIHTLRQFAETRRVVEIVGKYDSVLTKEFKAEDLGSISRVTVSMGNPLMKTIAGRLNMAEQFFMKGWIQSPEQLIQILETGRYEPAFEAIRMENLSIRRENEALMEGQTDGVVAMLTDKHLHHINEHKAVLATPEARLDPEIVKITLQHIQEHIDILMNPELTPFLNALGQQSMAPMMPPPEPPPPQGVNDPSAQPGGAPIPPGMEGQPQVRSLNTLKDPVSGQPLDVQPQPM